MYKASKLTLLIVLLMVFMTGLAHAELVGHWTFDDGAAVDMSGNGNDGTVQGDPQWIGGYKGGLALECDGDGDYIDTGNADDLAVWTICCWAKSPQAPSDHSFGGPIHRNQNYILQWDHSSPTFRGAAVVTDAGGWHAASFGDLSSETWYHLAATYDGENLKAYVNGKLLTDNADPSGPPKADTNTAKLGKHASDAHFFNGVVDDAYIYNEALDEAQIKRLMQKEPVAFTPNPKNEAVDVIRDVTLEWTPGEFAFTHNIYFGTAFDDVNDATVPTVAGLDVNSFDLGRLDFGKTYFWRIDEVNGTPDKSVFKGDVWSFEVEPYSIPIPGDTVAVTASSASNEFSQPEKTIDGSGLEADGSHAITPETMWFTASVDLDPWIQFELDAVRKLDSMRVWNSNGSAEIAIGWGVKDVIIEYSVDGENWDALADAHQFSRAPGLPTYKEYDTIDFGGAAAKYVRLNIQSNWGGILMSYGLSEVQFSMIPAETRTPDPESGAVDVLPTSVVQWRAGREAAQHTIYVGTDINAVAEGLTPSVSSPTNSLDTTSLDLQLGETYYWRVDEVNDSQVPSVWAGPVWSLSTPAALVVDDFESYSNLSPDRPFQTWLDGIGYSADDFFPVAFNGNGTGAAIGHDIWSVSSPHFDGTIMETSNTIAGSSQSMPFYYTNTGGVASQTERTFAVSQDWTIGGAKTLSIAFSGQADNTGTLYAKINGVQVTYPRDATNIAKSVWQVFNIDLSAINTNLSSVTTLSIGVDGAGASGMLLIDDIVLHPEVGQVITPVDPGIANLVGFWNFDAGSGTVVADSSGHGNSGAVEGGGEANAWVPGQKGTAISTSASAYVNVPAAAWSSIDTQFTVSFWAKGDVELGNNWTFFAGNTGRIVSGHLPWGSQVIFDTTENWNSERVVVDAAEDELRGQWRHWTFVRNAETGEKKLYLDGVLYGSADASADPITGIDRFFIGSGDAGGDPYVGLIDEFQLYDKALSAGEISWLAGRTTPIDKPF